MPTRLSVNGEPHEVADEGETLLAYLRERLGLTGAKPGCGQGSCGACSVLVDGVPVLSCRTTVGEVADRHVTTVEGLAFAGRLHPVQQALVEEGAAQCGYCTPAIALRAAALLDADPDPDESAVAAALDPVLCRCGCQAGIVRAVRGAAELLRNGGEPAPDAPDEPAARPIDLASLEGCRPPAPYDLSGPERFDFFSLVGEGLVAVWPAGPSAEWPPAPGAVVHVAPSELVTAFSGKVDVGQDNSTAFRLLVAEELSVDLEDVEVVLGDTDLCPYDAGTFGSRSMPDAGEALRRAAATARRSLVELAAARWGVPASTLAADSGGVGGGPSGSRLGYGELVAGLHKVIIAGGEPSLRSTDLRRLVGRPGHRPPRGAIVTGRARFVSDLEADGMGYGRVLHPPCLGAKLLRVDCSAASDLPGVQVVEEGDFVGVVADDATTARRAVAAVRADWDVPPEPDMDLTVHLRSHPAAAAGWERAVDESDGDVEAAFEACSLWVAGSYTTAFVAHVPLETRSALAAWVGDRLTVVTGTQVPFGVRAQLAARLGIEEADARVVVGRSGGGFGGKHAGDVAVEAAVLSRSVGRPVKVHWSRSDEFTAGTLRPMSVVDVKAGLDCSGAIGAWEFTNVNGGPAGLAPPYRTGTRRLRYLPADSPLRQGSYRALAATANNFARESHVDELAHLWDVDPVEFRLGHLEDERLAAVLSACASKAGWPTPPGGVEADRAVGIAVGLEKGGRVATCADVRVHGDGTVSVERIVTAYECGAVVNPDTVAGQVEGATVMALGGALFEAVPPQAKALSGLSLSDYRVPRFSDVPPIEVVLVDRPDLPPAGAGETPLIAVAPAIANAIFAATGRRLRDLPLLPHGRLEA